MPDLWTKYKEVEFFKEAYNNETPERLFYLGDDGRYYAYWPKSYKGSTSTLQSRNALIGKFTEKFTVDLLKEFARSKGWFSVQNVICEEIGLMKNSPADVALCGSKSRIQRSDGIYIIFEVKMSIVWNWELQHVEGKTKLICIGDFRTHKGNPGLLRSDSMLKAIGKSINIRVSGYSSSKIPIIVLGNTPITENYISKVDHLKTSGIIQGFWSVNPSPLDKSDEDLKRTSNNGFIRMDSYTELESNLLQLFSKPAEFFAGMKTKSELGRIIEIANNETEIEKKAEKFLSLIRC